MPAGSVEPGETIIVAAARETMEEAGIAIICEGILRIEHTPSQNGESRVRVFVMARPADDTPPKSIPDSETLGARRLHSMTLGACHNAGASRLADLRALRRGAGDSVAADTGVACVARAARDNAGVRQAIDAVIFAGVVALASDIAPGAVAADSAPAAGVIARTGDVAAGRQAAIDVGVSAGHIVVDAVHDARASFGADDGASSAARLFAENFAGAVREHRCAASRGRIREHHHGIDAGAGIGRH